MTIRKLSGKLFLFMWKIEICQLDREFPGRRDLTTRNLLLPRQRLQLLKRRLSPQNQLPRPRSRSQRQPKRSHQRNPKQSQQRNRKRSPRRNLTRSLLQSQQQNLTANRKPRQLPPHNVIGRKSPNISPEFRIWEGGP